MTHPKPYPKRIQLQNKLREILRTKADPIKEMAKFIALNYRRRRKDQK